MSKSSRLAVVACATAVLAACMSGPPGDPGHSRTGRNDASESARPKGVKPCPPTKAAGATKDNPFEREWERIDAEYEQALRDIVNEGSSAQNALATLDQAVLKPHNWSLSRYLVRVIHELQSNSVREASVEIGNETYAENALHDASWDGQNAWGIVQDVRGETLDIFVWLEKTRTTDNPRAREAQRVADGLINVGRTAQPWVFNGCLQPKEPPHDPANLVPLRAS